MFEFRHYMDDIFNGLLEAGFSLRLVLDPARDRQPPPGAAPESWAHEEAYVGIGACVIVAEKVL